MVLLLALSASAPADDPPLLTDQAPFDRITLNAANKRAVVNVLTLDFPGRKLPQPLPRAGLLRIRLLDMPDKQYDVPWGAIDKVELFEQLLLAQAEQLAAAGKHEEAYDQYRRLLERHPNTPGLQASLERYLINDAFAAYQAGRFDAALAALREVYALNPKRPGLDTALARVLDRWLDHYARQGDFLAVRRLLEQVRQQLGDSQQGLVEQWQVKLTAEAARHMAAARSAGQQGKWRDAYLAARQMVAVWPDLEGGAQLARAVTEKYPLVTVGVLQPSTSSSLPSLDDWAGRRCGRLRQRRLLEYIGPGPEGGQYHCPIGSLVLSDDRLTVTLRVDLNAQAQTPAPAQANLTGYDVAQLLLTRGDPGTREHLTVWSAMLAGVRVDHVQEVVVQLNRPHVRLEALLATIPLPSLASPGADWPWLGLEPYVRHEVDAEEVQFLDQGAYTRRGPTQPREIRERYFTESQRAVEALTSGAIDILDRVFPGDVPALENVEGIVVRPYAAPSLQLLIPNLKRPFPASRTFRRALVYGIDREAILARDMLGGQPPAGCRVLSGPFPAGSSSDDPLAYAYDTQIVPRPYEPRLAQTLVQVARREVQSARRAASGPDSPPAADPGDQRASVADQAPAVAATGQPDEPAPADKAEPLRLVLVHPAYETARLATESIAADLARIGIACTIQPLPPGATRPAHDEWDLRYADVVMQEPLVDARLLLARDGLAASDSPYVNLALQNLDQALSWRDARLRLRQLHRTTHDELTVIPLWQLTEYFAFRRGLRDVGSHLATLYQQIEQWQVSPDVGAP